MLAFPRMLAAKLMTWWAGSILCIVHYYYYTAPVERSTGIFLSLMFSFAKIHMVSWNYHDAGLVGDAEKSKHMTEREKHYAEALAGVPSFLDWIHYFYFVSTAGAGPMYEYRDFIDFINYTGDIKAMKVGDNVWYALKRFGEALFNVTIFLILSAKLKAAYMQTEEFIDEPFWFKLYLLIASMHITIFYHYFVFGGWEANLIASGFSYRKGEKDKTAEYNSVRGVGCVAFSTSLNGTQATTNWNMNTVSWLKYYVQMRLLDRTKPRHVIQIWPVASVFIASSVWHGPELGFAVFFLTLFLNSIIAKFFEKTKLAAQINRVVPRYVLFVPLWIWNYFQLSFGGMAFTFKTLKKFNNMHAAFGYNLFWLQPLLLAIAIALPKVKSERKEAVQKVSDTDNKKD